MTEEIKDELPWYHEGLRFSCRGCGNCCGGSPGVTNISEEEIEKAAKKLELEVYEFKAMYTCQSGNYGCNLSLREKKNYDCVFYKTGTGCDIYEERPRQCRTWPFWNRILDSSSTWSREAECCPGMNRGKCHSLEEIKKLISREKSPV